MNKNDDCMDAIKKLEKDKAISEDDAKRQSEDVQKATDGFIKKVDEILAQKEKDVMKV